MPLNAFTQDLIGGVRTLRKSPTHTIVAVLTIALGIALNTTMFSIVQAVLLRPLPYGFAEAVVLSDAAWRRLFGGDPAAIGKQVRIDTDLYTIVGVMPPDFHHPAAAASPDVDVWSTAGFRANPFSPQPIRAQRMLPSILARLKPGVTPAAAQQAIDTLAASIRQDHPGDYPQDSRWSMRIAPLQNVVVGDVQVLLLALSAAVTLVLLIGCANV